MKTIAVIEKNRCNFDDMHIYATPLLYTEHTDVAKKLVLMQNVNEYIWRTIEPYITFIQVSNDDLMTVACENLTKSFPNRQADEFFYHTEGSYSFPKKYIEFIYCQPVWKEYKKDDTNNFNNLGCLLSLKHVAVENNCIVLANRYDLTAPRFATIDSITKEDIVRIIRRRFFFTAILIKSDRFVKYYYQNPKYLLMTVYGLTDDDKIQHLPLSLLKYNLVFYFKHDDKTRYVNQSATRINGLHRLYGDVLILHEMEENIFANISIHEIKRLNVLSYGRLYDRELKNEEKHTITTTTVDDNGNPEEKKITPLWSRYIVIDHRMIQWRNNKNKCINCFKEMDKHFVCDKCYRVKYCSRACQNEFATYHSSECIDQIA